MNKLLTAKELSEKLNLSISKLAIDRMKERGIPFVKWKGQGKRGSISFSSTACTGCILISAVVIIGQINQIIF